jgi:hypothetical protein
MFAPGPVPRTEHSAELNDSTGAAEALSSRRLSTRCQIVMGILPLVLRQAS